MDEFKSKKLPHFIFGAGGGKKQEKPRSPVEADDTVNSRAMASILDLLGEGVIGGLVDGAKSIFLDNLPIVNQDGSSNFAGITWEFRNGAQDQTPIKGFDYVETPRTIGTQLKQSNSVTFSVDNDSADRVRVIMKFPSLRSIDKDTGDTNGTSVSYKFQIANAGDDDQFKDVIAQGEKQINITLNAKKTGVYYRSYELELPKPGRKYRVRVIRNTGDSTSSYLYNDTWVDSVGEIVDTPMNYPNSALVGVKVNSEQFGGSMPTRSYLVRGLEIRVPANYNNLSNTYVGVWDGSFQMLSSSNPAWILFDLLTNKRYGLGEFVSENMIDLGQIYQIGRYCDEEVDDGFGGKEKRFSINTQITSRQDAYRLIQDIAGAFRGMIYWAGGMVNVMQDCPSDPVMMFTNSNVKDGAFSYKGSARKDRPSVALVTYNNKDDGYKQNIEYVEDEHAMRRYGDRRTEVVAFGCTSRGQAYRVGLWLLYTSRMESEAISFTAGLDAAFLMPGESILIQNKYKAGKRNSGRIVAFTKNSITLDAPVSLKKSGCFIRIVSQEGKLIERDILETGENLTEITFTKALATEEMPVLNGVWVIAEPDLVPMLARVISVKQGEDQGSFEIVALEKNPTKYEAIDNGATLLKQNTTVLDPTFSKPSNLQILEGTYISSPGNLSVKLTAIWEGKSAEYWISWRRSDDNHLTNWQSARVTEEQYEIVNVAESGRYEFQVYAVSVTGKKTETISTIYEVSGTMTPPGAPTSLTAIGDYRNIVLNWINPGSIDLDHINVYASKTNNIESAQLIAEVSSTTFTHSALGDNETWYYWVRAVNKRGMIGPPNSNLGTEATTRDVLSFLQKKITSSELGSELLEELDANTEEKVAEVNERIAQSEASLQEKIQNVETKLSERSDTIATSQEQLKNEVAATVEKVNEAIEKIDNSDAAAIAELRNTVSEQEKAIANAVDAVNAAKDESSALVAQESEARIEGDEANAKQIEILQSSVEESQAAVEQMKRTVAEIDHASVDLTTTIEALAKTNIDLALRQDEDQHKQLTNNAKITSTQRAFADEISAMAEKVDEIRAEIGEDIRATITSEQTARADGDKALSTQITQLEAKFTEDISAAIKQEQEARATAEEATAEQINQLQAKVNDDITAKLTEEQQARADGDEALTSKLESLTAKTEEIEASIGRESSAHTGNYEALAQEVSSLKTKIAEDISAAITNEVQARTDKDNALTEEISRLTTKYKEDIEAAILAESKTQAQKDEALAQQITDLQTKTANDIKAAVQTETTARTKADSALTSQVNTLSSSVNGQKATIQQQAKAVSDINSKLSASYMLKMETTSGGKRYVAGVGLGIDSTGTSQFLIQADRFALINNVNGNITTPFVIDSGVASMNGAYIKDGTIDSAKFGDLQSIGFTPNKTGWRLAKNGTLEINSTSTGKGRMVITGNKIEVYDDNGNLRVRIGEL
ncbi:TPA: DUF1983 domain-containing protein [Escherichia coli]|nr:DUF1983 domain-containing protein [Escherichia coli]HBN7237003.1 DUF1983 domain-containing protein [Escherichia coli]